MRMTGAAFAIIPAQGTTSARNRHVLPNTVLFQTITAFHVVAAAFGPSIVLRRCRQRKNVANGQICNDQEIVCVHLDGPALGGPKHFVDNSRTLIAPRSIHDFGIDTPEPGSRLNRLGQVRTRGPWSFR
jgi:hypothetical protein